MKAAVQFAAKSKKIMYKIANSTLLVKAANWILKHLFFGKFDLIKQDCALTGLL
jgi:hypothetical protein